MHYLVRGRGVAAAVLIVLGCVLAPLAVVGVWAGNEVSNTDRYVANVAPLAGDPVIQDAVADRVTGAIMQRLDVPAVLTEVVGALEAKGLPAKVGDKLAGLAAPLGSGVQSFVREQTGKVVRSDAFEKIWDDANRVAHKQLDAVLSGDGGPAVQVDGGTVSLDLGPLVAVVKKQLVDAGLTLAANIPDVHPTFELFESADLAKAQKAYSLVNALRWVLPLVSLALIAGGVLLAARRRRALLRAGLGLAGAMLVLGVGLTIGRHVYLDAVAAAELNSAAASALFDTLVRFLRSGLRVLLVLGLVVALIAYLNGPARRARQGMAALAQRVGH